MTALYFAVIVLHLMIYIPNGPDIPEKVEQDLSNDNLVFFCGAGISFQNGLPLFKGLVERVCQKLGIDREKEPLLEKAHKKENYARMLDLIEGNQSFSVTKEKLRKKVIEILNQYKGKPDIHKALLDLSASPGNKGHRLVTTNFDRLFFKAGLNNDHAFFDSVPKLVALPRKDTWQHLTFLHGVIDEEHDPEGKHLILTGSDVGLAYLHDNWASRFIIQLFQDWTVLFIGCSVNDPVMQYLFLAIHENQKRRQNSKKQTEAHINHTTDESTIYAFVGYKDGQKESAKDEWRGLGVKPILYKITGNKDNENHSLLYNTIKKWACSKQIGLPGKKVQLEEQLRLLYKEKERATKSKRTRLSDRKVQLKEQLRSPYKKETDKEKANNVISSLNIDDKLARYFSQIDFAPDPTENNKSSPNKPVDISWLSAFDNSEKRANKIKFAPAKEKEAKSSTLEKLTKKTSQTNPPLWEPLSPLEGHIALWLCNHLDKKELVHWVIDKGCILHPGFKSMIRYTIDKRPIEGIQKTVLKKNIQLFWETVIDNNYLKSRYYYDTVYGIIEDLNRQYSPFKAKILLELLEPYIHFHTDWLSDSESDFTKEVRKPEIKINIDHYPSIQLKNEKVLSHHAEDFSDLLKKAMELAEKIEIIKNGEDHFYIIRPSIEEQNITYHTWIYLIDLTRDSFDMAVKKDRQLANLLLQKWQYYSYSLFHRLILYAVTKYPELDQKIALDLLSNEQHHVLWSISCQNEVFKYLKSEKYSHTQQKALLDLIMKGPPNSLFMDNIDDKIITEYKEKDIYKRLSCLKVSGISFPQEVEKYYHEIQSKYSLQNKEIHDFPYFHTGWRPRDMRQQRYNQLSSEQIYDDLKKPIHPLEQEEKKQAFQYLTEDQVDKAFEVLLKFSDSEHISASYWGAFCNGLSSATDQNKANEYFIKSIKKIEGFNDEFITECLWPLVESFGYKGGLLYYKVDKDFFKRWWKKLWDLSVKKEQKHLSKESSNVNMRAHNSLLGKLTNSIIQFLWSHFDEKTILKNGQIPDGVREYLSIIITQGAKTNPAVMFHFGTYLFTLWFLDKEWTKKHIKPLMNFDKHKNICKSLWTGYFYHVEVNPDFLSYFKKELLQMFLNSQYLYAKESEDTHKSNVLESVTELFLIATGGKWFENIFTNDETQNLKQKFILNTDILESLSRQIWVLLKDSKEKSGILWDEKIKPWIEQFWPAQKNMKTLGIAQDLSCALLYCGDKFPEALGVLGEHIKGVMAKNHYEILFLINGDMGDDKKRFDSTFDYPHDFLNLLNWNFPQDETIYSHYSEMLQEILNKIKNKHPGIEEDEKYIDLEEKLS